MLEETLNKALDYTRGNNTYLECVNNNLEYTTRALNNMEYGLRSDIQDLRSDVQSAAVGLYNMGMGIRDDIQTSTAMNINAIQGMAMGITSDIRASTYAVVASQNMLNQTFKQGFSSVNNTINLGLGLVGNKIDVLSKDISSKLYEIQDVLEHPNLTETRELYHRALGRYKKGFYEEALEDCLAALEIDKTAYISWYLLGLIYLFGAGKNGNVINLDKAEEAFDNARKYIEPEVLKSNETKLMASEIFYHLGFTRLAKSNDFLIENKIEDSNTKLLEAQNATAQAYSLSKENLIAGYEYAKELHFLGKDSDSLTLLEELIRKEKNFAIKSVNDKNFESLWTDIEKLIEKLKLEVCNQISDKLKENIKFYENKLKEDDEIANYKLSYKGSSTNIQVFNNNANNLCYLYDKIEDKDYFSVLSLKEKFVKDLEYFSHSITTLIHDTKNEINQKEEEKRKKALEERRRQEEREWQEREERRYQEVREWLECEEQQERKRKLQERFENNQKEIIRRGQGKEREWQEHEERIRQEKEEERRKQEEKKEKISGLFLGAFIGLILGLIALGFSDLVPSPGDWDFFPIGLIHIICAVIGFELSGILGAIVGLIIVFGSLLLLLVFPMVIVIILVIVGAVWGCVARTKP